jgi:hypothetical protein
MSALLIWQGLSAPGNHRRLSEIRVVERDLSFLDKNVPAVAELRPRAGECSRTSLNPDWLRKHGPVEDQCPAHDKGSEVPRALEGTLIKSGVVREGRSAKPGVAGEGRPSPSGRA